MKYRRGREGDKILIPFEGVRLVACCDCGLVHRHVYTVEPHPDPKLKGKGVIAERTYRDNRATDGIRRAMAKRGEIIAEHDANVYVIMPRIRRKRRRGRLDVKYEPY